MTLQVYDYPFADNDVCHAHILYFFIGIGAGLGLTAGDQGYLLPQISDTLRPLVNLNNAVISHLATP